MKLTFCYTRFEHSYDESTSNLVEEHDSDASVHSTSLGLEQKLPVAKLNF
jgi:hypothetical protein